MILIDPDKCPPTVIHIYTDEPVTDDEIKYVHIVAPSVLDTNVNILVTPDNLDVQITAEVEVTEHQINLLLALLEHLWITHVKYNGLNFTCGGYIINNVTLCGGDIHLLIREHGGVLNDKLISNSGEVKVFELVDPQHIMQVILTLALYAWHIPTCTISINNAPIKIDTRKGRFVFMYQ